MFNAVVGFIIVVSLLCVTCWLFLVMQVVVCVVTSRAVSCVACCL